VTTVTNV
jgi:hypothetical protein